MHVQRAIEAAGIPTMLITVEPAQSAAARPPRAVHPMRHAIGTPMGAAGEVADQRATLLAALDAVLHPVEPGTIREI
ncbi:MAG: hypothetical protein ACYDGM_13890 [Vulcanimicrobiaceae bacterium]